MTSLPGTPNSVSFWQSASTLSSVATESRWESLERYLGSVDLARLEAMKNVGAKAPND
jgi:hypothetical protein